MTWAFPADGMELESILDAVTTKPRFDAVVVQGVTKVERERAGATGFQVLRIKNVLTVLHEARILTIEEELLDAFQEWVLAALEEG